MTFSIRAVKQEDANAWERLRNLLWEGDDHKREIAEFLRGEAEEPNEVLLAIAEDGQAIAHIELSLRYDIEGLETIRTGYIEGLFVEDVHRDSGVALRLLRAGELWAKEQGCLAFASDRDDRVIVHARYRAGTP